MTRRYCEILAALTLVAGCQARPVAPGPAAPPIPAAFPATRPDSTAAGAQDVETDADRAMRQAAEQAKSIEALLAARVAAQSTPVPKPPQPAAARASAPTAPPPKSADGFRPVPPMGSPVAPPAVVSDTAAPTPPVVVAAPPAAVTPMTPTDPPEPARVATAGDGLEQQLAQKATQHPRDLAPQLDAQLLQFLKDTKVPTADAMVGLDMEDRDVLTIVLDGLTNFRNGIRQDGNLLVTRKIQPLVDMGDRLRSRADLMITHACVCRTVGGYGNYDPITPLRLTAGVASNAKLYYEIENVTPRLNTANMWATKLSQDIVLFDAFGKQAEVWPTTPVSDVCRNRRRDFFIGQKFQLSPKLLPGDYTLKITLYDLFANRISETSLPLTIVAARGPAAPAPAGPPLPR